MMDLGGAAGAMALLAAWNLSRPVYRRSRPLGVAVFVTLAAPAAVLLSVRLALYLALLAPFVWAYEGYDLARRRLNHRPHRRRCMADDVFPLGRAAVVGLTAVAAALAAKCLYTGEFGPFATDWLAGVALLFGLGHLLGRHDATGRRADRRPAAGPDHPAAGPGG